jgi:hypothetical protein
VENAQHGTAKHTKQQQKQNKKKDASANGEIFCKKLPVFGINIVNVYTRIALTLGKNGDMIPLRWNHYKGSVLF